MERRTGSQESGLDLVGADKDPDEEIASETTATTGLFGVGSQTR